MKRVLSASADRQFSVAAHEIRSRALLAHVRSATVGAVRLENVHPYRLGRWVFAHNGTVPAFDVVQRYLEAETPGWLMQHRSGTTDSELCFLWLLGRLEAVCAGATSAGAEAPVVAGVLRDGIRQLLAWCREQRPDVEPRLNFVLTDGRILLATRCGCSLYSLERAVLHGCELCGTCHCSVCGAGDSGDAGVASETGDGPAHHQHSRRDPVACRAFVVASEPITAEQWRQVDDRVVLFVDEEFGVQHLRI